MDRQIVYPGAIPLETDLLNTNKNAMIGLAKLAAAILGTSTFMNGLACTPDSPASLNVKVAPGEIYSLQNMDGTAYSSLAADTTHSLLKQGIVLDSALLSCPAPVTNGYSINYLVQVALIEGDVSPVVLPYYNASNPSQAYSGPNNSGTTNNTVRKCNCAVSVKAGVAAATGTQTTPAPDSGYTAAYVVTVAYSQTQITEGNISAYPGAPFLPSAGLVVGGLQGSACNISAAGGTADAITGSYTPGITALTNGMTLYVRASSANATTTPTFTPASGTIAAKTIVKGAGAALAAGDIAGGGHWIELQYDATLDKWVLLNPAFNGLQARGVSFYTTSSTLPLSDMGKMVLMNFASSGGTISLPSLASVVPGTTIVLFNWGATNTVGIAAQAGQVINNNSTNNQTFSLPPQSTMILIAESGTSWDVVSGSAQLTTSPLFAASLAANDYQKLPSGRIIQMGQFTASANTTQTVTLPIAFPNAFDQVLISVRDTVQSVGASPLGGAIPLTTNTFSLRNFYTASNLVYSYVAFGR